MNKAQKTIAYIIFVGFIILLYAISGFFTGELYFCGRSGCGAQYLSQVDAQEIPMFYLLFILYAALGAFILGLGLYGLFHPALNVLGKDMKPTNSFKVSLRDLDILIEYRKIADANELVLKLMKEYQNNQALLKRYEKITSMMKDKNR